MIVGCYTVHLYCDGESHEGYQSEFGYFVMTPGGREEIQNEFAGRNERDCLDQAKQVGWRITKARQAFCPFCK
jgi:hypothetical protein